LSYIVGVDIGGTFTDCVALDTAAGGGVAVKIGKASSTPPDFQAGFVSALRAAADQHGISLEDMLASARVYHGCTVGTNALVEEKTAKVGLLATRGHIDSTFIMRSGARLKWMPSDYIAHVARHLKPAPLVPRSLCEEIDERIAFDGAAVVSLNEDHARESIQRLVDAGVEGIAISLIWSSANPTHEQRLRELITEIAPELFVSVSHEVSARVGEYERTVATIINTMIGPPMRHYLTALETDLERSGYLGKLQIMSCSGGLIDADVARELPVLTIGSGPVAGLIGAASLSRTLVGDSQNVVTADIGGTTLDVGMIYDGLPVSRATASHGQYEYFVPTLDVRSVGSGGGSIIHSDGLAIKVGPQSAGADPGPICFGRGGVKPTVTDAAVMLGYFDPDYFFGGRIKLDVASTRKAFTELGEPFGLSAEEAAAAAMRIVNSQMADAIWLTLTQQGYDARDFVLYGFGGGGGLHAASIARELGISRAIIPLSDLAAGWSAFGIASSDALVTDEAGMSMASPFDPEEINRRWRELEGKVLKKLLSQGVERDAIKLTHHAEMRYALQTNQVAVAVAGGEYGHDDVERMVANFEGEYERLFGEGSGYAAAGFQLTSLQVRGRGQMSDLSVESVQLSTGNKTVFSERERKAWWNKDRHDARVFDGTKLRPGWKESGPVILEFPDTTVLVGPEDFVFIHDTGSVVITVGGV